MVPNEVYGVPAGRLREMTLPDALHLLAHRNHGRIDSTAIRPVLSAAGLLPPDTNAASSHLYAAIKATGNFESTGRGKYRFGPHPPPRPSLHFPGTVRAKTTLPKDADADAEPPQPPRGS